MTKKLAAIMAGVLIGVAVAFVRAGAFPFWSSNDKPQPSPHAAAPAAPALNPSAAPAPANQPEPNEGHGGVAIPSFAPLVKRLMPTVVNVSVTQKVKGVGLGPMGGGEGGEEGGEGGPGPEGPMPGPGPRGMPGPGQGPGAGPGPFGFDPYEQLRRFFGEMPREFKQHGLGSGVIISPDGYILSNNHVVGAADEIKVTLMDKRTFTARVIGKDAKTDLALIKIDTKDALPVAELGDSTALQVGDWTIAIGNPFGFSLTVTAGIVSAKGRILGGTYDDFIQTDASINPGNSGGPLFDINGKVIGINTAIYSRTGTSAGIGFAIPIDLAKSVTEQLRTKGKVVRGWLGVQIQEVTDDLAKSFGLPKAEGALVASVEKDSPAQKAGIQRGDVILKLDGRDIRDEHELPALVADEAIGKTITINVIRDGKPIVTQVTIGTLKDTEVASAKPEETGGDWGMQVGQITPEVAHQYNLSVDKGVVVRGVRPDSPAAEAGLQPGDVIQEISVDRVKSKIGSIDDFLAKAKEAKKDKKSALLLVQRGGASLYLVIKNQG